MKAVLGVALSGLLFLTPFAVNSFVQGRYPLCAGASMTLCTLDLVPDRTVSASIGVATLQPDEDWAAWMKRSDENLYRAKSAGRNRVVA